MIPFIIIKYNTEIVNVLFKCVYVRKRINIFVMYLLFMDSMKILGSFKKIY